MLSYAAQRGEEWLGGDEKNVDLGFHEIKKATLQLAVPSPIPEEPSRQVHIFLLIEAGNVSCMLLGGHS